MKITEMSSNQKKNLIITIAIIIVLLVVGIILYNVFSTSSNNTKMIEGIELEQSQVEFRDNVIVEDDSKSIQKNLIDINNTDSGYIFVYKKLPEFFHKMKEKDVFCIYPDKKAKEEIFIFGFCGKFEGIREEGNNYNVYIGATKVTDVFSKIYIDTEKAKMSAGVDAVFYPSKDVNVVYGNKGSPLTATSMVNTKGILATSNADKISIGNTELGYKFKETNRESLENGYIPICDELMLKVKHKSDSEDNYSVTGSITLEELAIKMLLDYQYDEKKQEVDINKYSIGVIGKQKANIKMASENSIGFDDIKNGFKEDNSLIDLEDVTESEKGKIVLGTYLIGWESALPLLKNKTNEVSYLSMGIAIQLTLTGRGELNLECNLEESGFFKCESNSEGKNTLVVKGYDYPNPVFESRKATKEENESKPTTSMSVKGEINVNLAVGTDIGICIMGMIPLKIANNFVELDATMEKTKTEYSNLENKEILKSNYAVIDNISYLIVSANSYFKMHMGAKINIGKVKYKAMSVGTKIGTCKKVILQYPSPIGFSQSQCGFGGIYVGEKYEDDELIDTYYDFEKETDNHSIITEAKDSLVGSLISSALSGSEGTQKLFNQLDLNLDAYKVDYFTAGVIYIRDENNIVNGAIVVNENVCNASGFHTAISSKKTKQLYSEPVASVNTEIEIGSLMRWLLKIDDFEDTNFEYSVYKSNDSDAQMHLIYVKDDLKVILLSSE